MSVFSSKKFVTQLTDSYESIPRAARRIIINADVVKAAKLCAGDVIALSSSDKIEGTNAFAVGIIWPSQELAQDTIRVSQSALLTAHIAEGAKAILSPLSAGGSSKSLQGLPSLRQIKQAGTIVLKETSENIPSRPTSANAQEKGNRRNWLPLLLREHLVDLKYITHTQLIDIVYEGRTRQFSLVSVSSGQPDPSSEPVDDLAEGLSTLGIHSKPQVWAVSWDSSVRISEPRPEPKSSTGSHKRDIETLSQTPDAYKSIGGLDKQISQIRDLLEIPLTRPDLFRHFGLKPPRGILLHGPPGTGKTHLARAIAASTRSSVLVVNGPELSSAYHGETEAKLRDVFSEAREKSPCIVVLDEVDALVPRREDGAGGEVEKRVVATLLTILDGMEDDGRDTIDGGDRVVVIGTTNRPNAIDPALRRPGRFDREIEIGIPNAEARLSILNVLLAKVPHSLSQDELRAIASRAHGYVGADLSAVVREAGTIAIKRWLSTNPSPPSSTPTTLTLTPTDLSASLPTVRPSAMRSLFLDTPPIYYADIGGQDAVIQRLREAVEWPLLHPEAYARLGVRPPKGVLLYGPPGCSKTVLVRACACESGVNFVAVKGPELLNKYVGESERGVREIFRKARAAAPSIIFFDEIDALASSRSDSGSHEGVLTSLLNEMDGVQELLGVTVIAATNRPDVLDPALTRPGRLDHLLYVPPPSHAARLAILAIHTRRMPLSPAFSLDALARLTRGCSGAEVGAVCREAGVRALREGGWGVGEVGWEMFVRAAGAVGRGITGEVLERFERWGEGRGVEGAGVVLD